jgi:hypothetical protein
MLDKKEDKFRATAFSPGSPTGIWKPGKDTAIVLDNSILV